MYTKQQLLKMAELADFLDANGAEEDASLIDLEIKRIAEEEGVYIPEDIAQDLNERFKNLNVELADTIEQVKQTNEKLDLGEDKAAFLMKILIRVADKLDAAGDKDGANFVDKFIKKYAFPIDLDKIKSIDPNAGNRYDSRYIQNILIKEPKKNQERPGKDKSKHYIPEYETTGSPTLSTRHCIDHPGTSLIHIGPSVYQCPLDGAIYNWEEGFTTMDGEKIPGGSIANQTPDRTEWAGDIKPFDSRQTRVENID